MRVHTDGARGGNIVWYMTFFFSPLLGSASPLANFVPLLCVFEKNDPARDELLRQASFRRQGGWPIYWTGRRRSVICGAQRLDGDPSLMC